MKRFGRFPSMRTGTRMTMTMSEFLRKYFTVTLMGIGLVIMQTTCFGINSRLAVTPDLAFAFVVALSFCDGVYPGCIAAVAAGFLCDTFGNAGTSYLIPLYFAVALAVAFTARQRLTGNIGSFFICVFSACIMKALYYIFYVSIRFIGYSVTDLLGKTVIPEFALTVVISLPMYLAVKRVMRNYS